MNHRLDNDPRSAPRTSAPTHRAEPPLAATRRHTRRSFTLITALAAAVVAVPTALAVSGPGTAATATPATVVAGPELVSNGGFENGTTGWHTNQPDQFLTTSSNLPGDGTWSGVLTRTGAGNLVINDTVNTVTSTTPGTTYDISAMVRSATATITGQLIGREFNTGGRVGQGVTGFTATTSWQHVTLTYTSIGTGNALELNVMAPNAVTGASLRVDDLSMRAETTGTTTTAPTTTPTSSTVPTTTTTSSTVPTTTTTVPTTTTTAAGCINTVNGIPPRGSGVYVGAAAGGNQSYTGLETATGMTLREHRTYFTADQVAGAVRMATSDVAAGRLPWISFKLPYTWADMANGKGDAWAIDLTQRLATVGGPVWIAFHHEPIEDLNGSIQDWVRMQQHLAPIVHNNSNNIAYTVIFSAWNVTYGTYRLSQVWPGAGVDILGIDIYNNYNVRSTKMTDPMHFIPIFQQWADSHGIRWAIAESGYTKDAADIDPTWLDTMYSDSVAGGVAAFSYFDSSLATDADWTLDTAPKLDAFTRILAKSTKIC
jgi:hypothetical protein